MTSWEKPRRYALRVWPSTYDRNGPHDGIVATYAYSAADAIVQCELEFMKRVGGEPASRVLSVGPWHEREHGKWPLQEWPE